MAQNNTKPKIDLKGKTQSPRNLRQINLHSSTLISDESVEQLRERLNTMKKLMADKQAQGDNAEFWKPRNQSCSVIDGNFLSVAFGGALLVIVTVSIYAFYNLYHAILKKFPSKHTEL